MRDMRLVRPDDGVTGGGNGAPDGPTTPNPQTDAVTRYRELVASQSGLVLEMVRGETVEEIDSSAAEARRAYGEISRHITEQFERAVPPGNPPRSSADVGIETLKPEAKIALGLKRIGQ